MKHGSLFSGIGGFDLAADWMGWENVFHCEIAEFPRKILNHYWPNAECHEDIKKTDFTKYRGTVDIISGGFPCQPYSAAGKRLGKEDDRHLWPEMLRVIREVKPQWVVGENVRGLLNWNGGMVFHEVCADLENIGYEVQAFIIPASGINAPHQRERLWIVAHSSLYANGLSTEGRMDMGGELLEGRERKEKTNRFGIISKDAPDTDSNGQFKGWRHDSSSKNNERCNSSQQRTTDSENFNRCCPNGIFKNESRIGGRIGKQTNDEKNKSSESTGICKMDTTNDIEEIIKNNENSADQSGTLVSSDCKGLFTSDNRGLEHNETSFRELESMGLSINIPRIYSMDRNAPDTESQRTWEQSSENRGREDGRFNDISEDGNATDTDSIRLERKCRPIGEFEREIRFSSTSSRNMWDTAWDNFPTQSPVCGGDDGISHRLDNITFSKWRNESIKGYGNAVVPQVVYRIFKTIEYIQNLKP
jgi:DNA (cytosine-5)-methyltransferase 1